MEALRIDGVHGFPNQGILELTSSQKPKNAFHPRGIAALNFPCPVLHSWGDNGSYANIGVFGDKTSHNNINTTQMLLLDETLLNSGLWFAPCGFQSLDALCMLLDKCTGKKDILACQHLYFSLVSSGLDSVPVVVDHLIRLFDHCGSVREADQVFWKAAQPSVYTWNAIIAAHVCHGEIKLALEYYNQMVKTNILPNDYIFTSVLKACATIKGLEQGELVHKQIIETGFQFDLFVASSLIDFYSQCVRIDQARRVFDGLPKRNEVIWGAMITGYTLHGHVSMAIDLFQMMQFEGIEANEIIFTCLLKAFGTVGDIDHGMQLHTHIMLYGLESKVVIGNRLIDMYLNCANLEEGQAVFKQMPIRNVETWNAIITVFAENDHGFPAVELFEKMERDCEGPNGATLSCVLNVCGRVGNMKQGELIHDWVVKAGMEVDVYIGSGLVDMYCKCGDVDAARKVFDDWPDRNIVTYGAMIAGYAQHGLGHDVLELFNSVHGVGFIPNEFIFSSALKGCASIGALQQGKLLHEQICRSGIKLYGPIGSSLIDMYAKCGQMDMANKVFDELPARDVASWGAMIAGYAQHMQPHTALQLFENMENEGCLPDKGTFGSLLGVCGGIGATEQGKTMHHKLITRGFESDTLVGNALISMYARLDCLEDAHAVFSKLPCDIASWTAMISAYAQHGKCSLARQYLKDMQQYNLVPDDIMLTSILKACSCGGHVEEGKFFFRSFREDHNIQPKIEHLGCMVDLLGQGGFLIEGEELLEIMPMLPDCMAWTSLLASCRMYGCLDLGRTCFDQVIKMYPETGAAYVLMIALYADAGMWQHAREIEELRNSVGAWKVPGRAWIEVDKEVHEFVVGDCSHPHNDKIQAGLKRLSALLKKEVYVPQLTTVVRQISRGKKAEVLLEHCEKVALAFGLLSSPQGTTIRIVKNLGVCNDCHSVSKIVSSVKKRGIVIKDSHCVHLFLNGECSCSE